MGSRSMSIHSKGPTIPDVENSPDGYPDALRLQVHNHNSDIPRTILTIPNTEALHPL